MGNKTREIKFRAWISIDNGKHKMMYFDDIFFVKQQKPLLFVLYDQIKYGGKKTNWISDMNNLKDIPIMQFTGLKDKNGKEIYEGDIVKGVVIIPPIWDGEYKRIEMTGIVFWDLSGFELRTIKKLSDSDRPGRVNYFSFVDGRDGSIFDEQEVIGNTYENPGMEL